MGKGNIFELFNRGCYLLNATLLRVGFEMPALWLLLLVVVYLTSTDPLRIQPWSQDRRD